jgi:hypothetical protein
VLLVFFFNPSSMMSKIALGRSRFQGHRGLPVCLRFLVPRERIELNPRPMGEVWSFCGRLLELIGESIVWINQRGL